MAYLFLPKKKVSTIFPKSLVHWIYEKKSEIKKKDVKQKHG